MERTQKGCVLLTMGAEHMERQIFSASLSSSPFCAMNLS